MDTVTFRDFGAGDMDWLVDRHGALYAEEEGFDESFAPIVRQVAQAFLDRRDSLEAGWIAQAGADRVGSIFCTRLDTETVQIRLFLLEPAWRGTGLGARMLRRAEDFARGTNCSRMRLWTHESHAAACALYRRAGWSELDRRPVRNYGRALVELSFGRDL